MGWEFVGRQLLLSEQELQLKGILLGHILVMKDLLHYTQLQK